MHFCFTDRFGGVSQALYESFNLGLHVNDNAVHVTKNRDILREKIGASKLVFMNQVHGDKVVLIEHGDEMPECDAMITSVPDIALAVMVADCIPILLYDAAHHAIGVAHAGREGTRLHVGQKCALAMQKHFGTEMKTLHVWMGPSIHACCYEVGIEATQGLESVLHVKEERYFLDLQRYNVDAFLALGMKAENVKSSDVCTCCNADYFSYRRENQTGRFAGVITV